MIGENNDHYIIIYENTLSKELCESIIKSFEENNEQHYVGGTIKGIDLNIKNTKEMVFSNSILNKYDNYLFESLRTHLKMYFNVNTPFFMDIDDTGYQIQKYVANEGFYTTHVDSETVLRNNKLGTRVITFIWYLNDVEEGGETFFDNLKIKPKTGSLLLFPATWTYPHRGGMPISNDKYIITGWVWDNFIIK